MSMDQQTRSWYEDRRSLFDIAAIPVTPAWAPAPQQQDAVVALVTTADVRPVAPAAGLTETVVDRGFERGYRVLRPSTSAVVVGHRGQDCDRLGAAVDPNVVYPVDRLRERAHMGVIKGAALSHMSLACEGHDPHDPLSVRPTVSFQDVAAVLRASTANVAILLPMCPACELLTVAAAHAIESAGVATVCIVFRRDLAERMSVPRALHVPFPFGRPFGVPLDRPFQHRVLSAALGLLGRRFGPILDTFGEEVHSAARPLTAVSPPRRDLARSAAADELVAVRTGAIAVSREQPPGSASTLAVPFEAMPDALDVLSEIADGARLDEVELPGALTDVVTDLRVQYEGLAISRSGDGDTSAWRATEWFYAETEAGLLVDRVRQVLRRQGEDTGLVDAVVPAALQAGRRGEIAPRVVRIGLAGPTALRWADGELWVSDAGAKELRSLGVHGTVHEQIELGYRPTAIDWLPDGTRVVLDPEGSSLYVGRRCVPVTMAFPKPGVVASGLAVCDDGTIFVGSDQPSGAPGRSAGAGHVFRVGANGANVVVSDLASPRSLTVLDRDTLLVAEAHGRCLTAFTVSDGGLRRRRLWADLGVAGITPHEMCADDLGGVWVADAQARRVVRVEEGGFVTDEISFDQPCVAVALGGSAGRTLFVATAPGLGAVDWIARRGEIWALPVFGGRRRIVHWGDDAGDDDAGDDDVVELELDDSGDLDGLDDAVSRIEVELLSDELHSSF